MAPKILIRFKASGRIVAVTEAEAMQFVDNGEAVLVRSRECATASPPCNAMQSRPRVKERT